MRQISIALVLVMLFITTACQTETIAISTPSPMPTATSEPTPTAPAIPKSEDLEPFLLSLDDMPPGWTIESTEIGLPEDASSRIFCKEYPYDTLARAERRFSKGDLGPVAFHTILIKDVATDYIDLVKETSDSCKEPYSDDRATWEVSPMSFPAMGESSFAVLITNDQGLEVKIAYIAIGDHIVLSVGGFGLQQLGGYSTDDLVDIASDSVAKIAN